MNNKKWIGIDFGLKRIGLAIFRDPVAVALPIGVIPCTVHQKKNIKNILQFLNAYLPIEKFVIGLPLHLSGEESAMSIAVKKFAVTLQDVSKIPYEFVDERCTSKMAENILREGHYSRKRRANIEDSSSATIILQTYIDHQKGMEGLC